jgi:hypothetical protein
MFPLPGFLTGGLWKIMTGLAGLLSIALSLALANSYFQNRTLQHQVAVIDARINDPKTGFIMKLAQADTNVATLKVALDQQNLKLQAQSDADAKALSDVEAALDAVQHDNQKKDRVISKFLAIPPKGDTLIDRYQDIDQRLVGGLK